MEVVQVEEEDQNPAAQPWWYMFRIESRREGYCLSVATIFSLIFLSLLLFVVIVTIHREECHPHMLDYIEIPKGPSCQTPECIDAANHILQHIDQTVDPCDNFYEFACGNFRANKLKFELNGINALNKMMDYTVKRWLTQENASDPINIRNQRKFYKSCMDLSSIEKDNGATFLNTLQNAIGDWPQNENPPNFNWADIMITSREFGLPFDFFLSVDVVYREKYYLQVGPPPVPNWFINMDPPVHILIMQKIAHYVYKQRASLSEEVRIFYVFVKKFVQLLKTVSTTPRLIKISKLNNPSPYLGQDWSSLLSTITSLNITNNDVIAYGFEDDNYYFKSLNAIIKELGSRFAMNYVIFNAILAECGYLSKGIQAMCQKFVLDRPVIYPREIFCRRESAYLFSKESEMYYTKQVVSGEKRKQAANLIEEVIQALKVSIANDDTLSNETKKIGVKYLNHTNMFIGYADSTFLEQEYFNIYEQDRTELTSNNVIDQLHQITRDNLTSMFRWYHSSPEPSEYLVPPMVVTPQYAFLRNVIYAMTPALMQPIFELNRPEYLNFAFLGTLAGSAFVKTLISTEHHGTSRIGYTDWEVKLEGSIRKFKDVCIFGKYDAFIRFYRLSHFMIRGNILNELISDFGGVNLAHEAYQKWTEKHGPEQPLPGLNYTANQLFWILSSTYLCADEKLETGKFPNLLHTYFFQHAIPSFRVNGRASNSPYFAKDFNCNGTSGMYVEDKCTIFTS